MVQAEERDDEQTESESGNSRSHRPKITILESLGASELRTLLFQYENYRRSKDKMKNFLSLRVFKWVNSQLEDGKIMSNDVDVKQVLETELEALDQKFKLVSFETISSELKWPVKGSTGARINNFFVDLYNLLERLPPINTEVARVRLNKAII